MAIRPAEALLGLSGELGRVEALELHNRGRPAPERSGEQDRLADSRSVASELDNHPAARSDGLSLGAVLAPHTQDRPDHCRAARYRLANLLPSIPPMTDLHTRMPYRAG